MQKILLALVAILAFTAPVSAQSVPSLAVVVGTCGTPPSTYSTGTNRPVTQDTTGKICDSGGIGGNISIAPATAVTTAALAANLVVHSGATTLISFDISADSTLSAAAWWVMIYNATSAPADGSVTPVKCYAVPTGTTVLAGAFTVPITFSTGVVIGVSTMGCFDKAESAHAFISGDYQ